jgi:UDPglucose 6-dehydrogenase
MRQRLKISVIGLGYLGATHAVAMAQLGHEVLGVESNPQRLATLQSGRVPFFEPGLETALESAISTGRIRFLGEISQELASCEAHFICVGTPQASDSGSADLRHIYESGMALEKVGNNSAVVIGKSTVPVGTAAELKRRMSEVRGSPVKMVWNPEFLREGTALEDSLHPDRIVFGIENGDARSETVLREIYQPVLSRYPETPVLVTNLETAELVKAAANSFLATKISFINAMAEICEVVGANASELATAIGLDERIGSKFLRNGIGFGGGCLPKDIRAFMARADELGVGRAVDFLADIDAVNLRRRERVATLATELLGEIAGKKITMLGAAFKPDSDDLRDSPALAVANLLARAGAVVSVHDPLALERLGQFAPDLIAEAILDAALEGAELVVLGTEWSQYRELNPATITNTKNRIIIDGRNALDEASWQAAGWRFLALGRGDLIEGTNLVRN